jgi:acyl-coenzyme A thioesterase PaaI-like protein
MVAALGVTSSQAAGTSAPATFTIQAKVLQVGSGWLQVQVLKVTGGALKANARVRIRETAKTRFLRAGAAASARDLKAGQTVEVEGTVIRSGKTVVYQATTVTILQ